MVVKQFGCMRLSSSHVEIDADLHSFTPLAWIMSSFLAIECVTAVNPMRQNVAVLEHKIQFHYVLKNSIFYARTEKKHDLWKKHTQLGG